MTKTANRRRKVIMPISIKKKLAAAMCMLLIAAIMMISSTYAWFTLSTAPEVKGITTHVGANGNLEITLLDHNAFSSTAPDLDIISGINDSLYVDNKDVTLANTTWGNLVDLSKEYGLSSMTLLPGALNIYENTTEGVTTRLISANSPIYAPNYGSDGRVINVKKITDVGKSNGGLVYPYDDGNNKRNGVGIVGVTSSMTVRLSAYKNAAKAAGIAISEAAEKASSALTANANKLANIMVSIALDTGGTTKFTNRDMLILGAIIDGLEEANNEVWKAIKQIAIVSTLSAENNDNLKDSENNDLSDQDILDLVDDISNATSWTELQGIAHIRLSDDDPAYTQLNAAYSYYNTTVAHIAEARGAYNELNVHSAEDTWTGVSDPGVEQGSGKIKAVKISKSGNDVTTDLYDGDDLNAAFNAANDADTNADDEILIKVFNNVTLTANSQLSKRVTIIGGNRIDFKVSPQSNNYRKIKLNDPGAKLKIDCDLKSVVESYNEATYRVDKDSDDENKIYTFTLQALEYEFNNAKTLIQCIIYNQYVTIYDIPATGTNKDAIQDAVVERYLNGEPINIKLGEDSGTFYDIAKLAGNYSTSAGIDASVLLSGSNGVIDATMQTNAADPILLAAALNNAGSEPASGGSSGNIADFYGYIIDFGFRTNAADGAKLQLQDTAANRVYSDITDESAPTQGGGTYVEFRTTDKAAFTVDNVRALMSAMRIVFTTPVFNGTTFTGYKVIAIAVPAITIVNSNGSLTYTSDESTVIKEGTDAVGIKIGLKLYMSSDQNGFTLQTGTAGDSPKVELNTPSNSNVLAELTQNVATKISTIIYFDGDYIDNTMVANAEKCMSGKINLQFATDAPLVPMENAGIRNAQDQNNNTPTLTWAEKVESVKNTILASAYYTGLDESVPAEATLKANIDAAIAGLEALDANSTAQDISDAAEALQEALTPVATGSDINALLAILNGN